MRDSVPPGGRRARTGGIAEMCLTLGRPGPTILAMPTAFVVPPPVAATSGPPTCPTRQPGRGRSVMRPNLPTAALALLLAPVPSPAEPPPLHQRIDRLITAAPEFPKPTPPPASDA